jgi:hypothetical protein
MARPSGAARPPTEEAVKAEADRQARLQRQTEAVTRGNLATIEKLARKIRPKLSMLENLDRDQIEADVEQELRRKEPGLFHEPPHDPLSPSMNEVYSRLSEARMHLIKAHAIARVNKILAQVRTSKRALLRLARSRHPEVADEAGRVVEDLREEFPKAWGP